MYMAFSAIAEEDFL